MLATVHLASSLIMNDAENALHIPQSFFSLVIIVYALPWQCTVLVFNFIKNNSRTILSAVIHLDQ